MTTPPTSESWRPKNAWVCLAIMALATILFGMWLVIMSGSKGSRLIHLRLEHLAILQLAGSFLWLGITVYLSRIQSWEDFKISFGLTRASPQHLLTGIGLGLFAAIIFHSLADHGAPVGLEWNLPINAWTLTVLMAAFFEEPIFRGYLYTSFRNRFSQVLSTALVSATFVAIHPQVWHSFAAFAAIVILSILLCVLREKTMNLWPSIACHFAYNFYGSGWS